ncbi:recombinase family protein [Nocardiopsis sp. FIRDI 009]|uniref:recombinase family protein n=1 Tax=Nocardiopsis sp. FIRDI 009 TaxID=714197 RepID=UPI002106A6DC|nr:recombinase family protein [Nocardiopsis sp. FIRDI 009]
MSDIARKGHPHGQAPIGLRAVHDTRTGKLVTWEEDPKYAPLIRELFDMVRRGVSIRGATMQMNADGWRNRSGNPFTDQHVRSLLKKPAYAGFRSHHGTMYPATWEPIVDTETFWAVQSRLSGTRKGARPGRAGHPFTMTLRCGVCVGPLSSFNPTRPTPDGPRYRCHRKGCVRVAQAPVDEFVTELIVGYLSRADVYEDLSRRWSGASGELSDVRGQLAERRANLAELEGAEPATLAEARVIARSIETNESEISDLEKLERELSTPPDLLALIEPGGDVRGRWEATPLEVKRRVARLLLVPGVLGEVRIRKAAHRLEPATDRLVIRRD